MSASITIGGLALGSDGKTLTASLANGSGAGYAPSSGITGLSVSDGTYLYNIASTAISGTTLTITLGPFIKSGATVTVTILAGSNLTDSGSNTAQGQAGVAVTNGSTVTGSNFNLVDPAIEIVGQYTNEGIYYALKFDTEFYFEVTTTDLSIAVYSGSGYQYTIQIDNDAPSVINGDSDNNFKRFLLFSGSSTLRRVRLHATNQAGIALAATFLAAGASVVPARPSDIGTYYNLNDQTTNIAIEGGPVQVNAGGQIYYEWNNCGTLQLAISPDLSGNDILIRLFSNDTILCRLSIGGTIIGDATVVNDYTFSLQTAFTGIAPSGDMEIRLDWIGPMNKGAQLVVGVMFVNATLKSEAHDVLETAAFAGDSITYGYGLTDRAKTAAWNVGIANNQAIILGATAGWTVQSLVANYAQITGRIQQPTRVWVNIGQNNLNDLTGFKDAYVNLLTLYRNNLPAETEIWCQNLYYVSSEATACGLLVQDAVNEVRSGVLPGALNTFFQDVTGINPATQDGVHPTDAGMIIIASFEGPIMFPPAPSGNALLVANMSRNGMSSCILPG